MTTRVWIHALRAFSLAMAATCLVLAGGRVLAADDAHTVVQSGRAFRPGEIALRRGETLTFANRDAFIHQVYIASDAMTFDSDEQQPGQTVTVTFPAAGTFEVRCHIHPRMGLRVHVK